MNGTPHTVKTDANGNYNYTFTAKKVGQNEIIVKYKPEKVNENKFDELNEENLQEFIFYLKLRKCLNLDRNKPIIEKN